MVASAVVWNRIREAVGAWMSAPVRAMGTLVLAVLAVTSAVVLGLPSVFAPLEAQTYDRLFRLRSGVPALAPEYSGTVVHVPIDDRTLQQREGFYVGRTDFAQVIRNLGRAEVAAQFVDVIFAAPRAAEGDQALADASHDAGPVFYGMALGIRDEEPTDAEREEHALPDGYRDVFERERWRIRVRGSVDEVPWVSRYFMTFPQVASRARGSGFLDLRPDRDGVIRRAPLLARDGDRFVPSLALRVLCAYFDVPPERIELRAGHELILEGARRPGSEHPETIEIPIDRQARMIVNFVGPWGRMTSYPFRRVYEVAYDRFELEDFRDVVRDKIALVHFFSTGSDDIGAVPTDPAYPRSGIWANAINSVLTGEYLRDVSLPTMLAIDVLLLGVLLLAARHSSGTSFVVLAVGLILGYALAAAGAFLLAGRMPGLATPLLALTGSTLVLSGYRYHLSAQERAKIDRELGIARDIQMRTLPSTMPAFAGYDLAGRSEPAEETGGDSFDVIPLDEHRVILMLSDATGHGIGPALSVTQVRSMLRVAIRLGADLDTAVAQINDQLSDDLAANRFVTAFVGVLDRRTHTVSYHSAGQGPLMHYRAADDSFDWFGSTSMPLGMIGGLPLKPAQSRTLEPGDVLGLMSDGVFEQEDHTGEQFGEERVAALVRVHRDSMETLVDAIYRDVHSHRDAVPQSDDISAVLIRRLPEEP